MSHNSAEHIERCIKSVQKTDWDILIVDNASTDDSVEKARCAASHVRVLANVQNRGFAGALNQAGDIAEGQVFLVLNPDTVAHDGAITELLEHFADQRVAAVGGMLEHNGRPEKGFTVRRFPTLGSALAEVLLLNRIWPDNWWNRRYRYRDLDYTKVQEVEQPAGACIAIRRSAWKELAGFDGDFFPVWFEDVDFCRRLHQRGWKVLYCPDAVFSHAGAHSVSQLSFKARQAFWYRNLLLYFRKHHPRWQVTMLRLGIFAGIGMRALLTVAGFRPPGVSLFEALAGYGHVLRYHSLWKPHLMSGKEAQSLGSQPAHSSGMDQEIHSH